MQLNILAAILATIAATNAGPAPVPVPAGSMENVVFGSSVAIEAPASLDKRAPSVAVKLCENDNGGGYCESDNVEANAGKCYNLEGNYLNNKVTSVYIYPAGFRCRFYDGERCGNPYIDYNSGAYPNVGKEWNDRFSSLTCFTA